MTFVQVISTSLISSFLTLFMALPAQAQTTSTTLPAQSSVFQNIQVSGSSGYDNTSTPAQPIIIGGYTGPYGECTTTTTGLCNACTALTSVCDTTTGIYQCAERSITDDTVLTISFSVNQLPANASTVVVKTTNQTATIPIVSQSQVIAGSTITVQVKWGDLCRANNNVFNGGSGASACMNSTGRGGVQDTLSVSLADGSGNLSSNGTQQFTLKILYIDGKTSANNPVATGNSPFGTTSPFLPGCIAGSTFCDYGLGSGDEKVYVNSLQSNSSTSDSSSNVKVTSAHLFFAPYGTWDGSTFTPPATAGFCSITSLASANAADLYVKDKSATIGNGYGVASNVIDSGLQNEQPYVFVLASQDEASIISGFMDQSQFLNNTACNMNALDGTCPYLGFPGQVIGLLSDQKCFIATAAYGTPMESHVMILRHFRNQFLLTNTIGSWFVHTYYRFSPPLANWIAHHETARMIARTMLWPAVWMAEWVTGEHVKSDTDVEPGAKK